MAQRVNHQQLRNYIGQEVKLVGKILKVSGVNATMETSDGGRVSIMSNKPAYGCEYVEVTGTTINNETIREKSHVELGSNFDMNIYEEALKRSRKYAGVLF